jgi:hypothetical protein
MLSIWLSALLILLSVAASAHEAKHYDDGATTHCTLCFHQHQLNQIVHSSPPLLAVVKQGIEVQELTYHTYMPVFTGVYLARGPPFTPISNVTL